jgi:hypothetical protein
MATQLNVYPNQQHIITGRLRPRICRQLKVVHISEVSKDANVECKGRETL